MSWCLRSGAWWGLVLSAALRVPPLPQRSARRRNAGVEGTGARADRPGRHRHTTLHDWALPRDGPWPPLSLLQHGGYFDLAGVHAHSGELDAWNFATLPAQSGDLPLGVTGSPPRLTLGHHAEGCGPAGECAGANSSVPREGEADQGSWPGSVAGLVDISRVTNLPGFFLQVGEVEVHLLNRSAGVVPLRARELSGNANVTAPVPLGSDGLGNSSVTDLLFSASRTGEPEMHAQGLALDASKAAEPCQIVDAEQSLLSNSMDPEMSLLGISTHTEKSLLGSSTDAELLGTSTHAELLAGNATETRLPLLGSSTDAKRPIHASSIGGEPLISNTTDTEGLLPDAEPSRLAGAAVLELNVSSGVGQAATPARANAVAGEAAASAPAPAKEPVRMALLLVLGVLAAAVLGGACLATGCWAGSALREAGELRLGVEALPRCGPEEAAQCLPAEEAYDCAIARPVSSGALLRLELRVEGPLGDASVLTAPLTQRPCVLYSVGVARKVHDGVFPVPVAFASASAGFACSLVGAPHIRIELSGEDVSLFDVRGGRYVARRNFVSAPDHWQDFVLAHRAAAGGEWQTSSSLLADRAELEFEECALPVGSRVTAVGELARGTGGQLSLRPWSGGGPAMGAAPGEQWRTSWERQGCASPDGPSHAAHASGLARVLMSDDPALLAGDGFGRLLLRGCDIPRTRCGQVGCWPAWR